MPAPKERKFYINRNKDGTEFLYTTPEELLKKAYRYFRWCDKSPLEKNEVIKTGSKAGTVVKVEIERPYTLIGLCNYIGISRATFDSYEQKEEFLPAITHLRGVIRQNQIERAVAGNYSATVVSQVLGLPAKQETETTAGFTIATTSEKTKMELQKLQEKLQSNLQHT